MAKSFLVSPGRAYLVIAGEGTKIVRSNGTLIDTVPEGANNVSITVDTHEIIVMDNSAKIQQLYNGNSGSSGIMTAAEEASESTWRIEIVSTLPPTGSPGVIYMLRTTRTGTDRYDDYIWIAADNAYELLGRRPETSTVDLSNVAKTNMSNTFTQSQRVQAELYATTLSANSIDCETVLEAGHVSAISALVDSAQIVALHVTKMTVLKELSVDNKAAIQLPGMSWTLSDTQNIFVTRTLDMQKAVANDTMRVSNVLTLGSSSSTGDTFELDGTGTRKALRLATSDSSSKLEATANKVTLTASAGSVTLSGTTLEFKDSSTAVAPLFTLSIGHNTSGAIMTTNGNVTMNGIISIPGTLNVHNLNVSGAVTGITTGGGGGGTTPTVDFSNGVTIMNILTADDIVADDIVTNTLTANNSISVSGTTVISRNGTSILLNSTEATATKLTATTIVPQYIQGATLTGPLVMTKDNALEIWGSGTKTTLSNGNITGVYYAQIDQCTVTHALSADSAKISRASVTDTLVVKDLVVTGTTTGITTGGTGEGSTGGGGASPDLEGGVIRELSVVDTLTAGILELNNSTVGGAGSIEARALHDNGNKVDNIDNCLLVGHNYGMCVTGMFCFMLGADAENTDWTPISVVSPLVAEGVSITDTLTVKNLHVTGNATGVSAATSNIFPNGIEIVTHRAASSSTGSLSVTGYFDPGYCSYMDCKLQVDDASGSSDGTRLCAHALLLETGDAASYPLPYGYGTFLRSAMVCLTDYDNSAMLSLYPVRYATGYYQSAPLVALHAENIWDDVYGLSNHEKFALESDIIMCRELRTTYENQRSNGGLSIIPQLDMFGPTRAFNGLSVVHSLSVDGGVHIAPREADDTISAYALTVVNALTVDGSISTNYAYVTRELVAPNIKTTRQIVHTTPTGTADTLCRWAQIGKTHEMLAVGHLSEITLPGPSVQKLDTNATVTSFMLSLWYQADDAGNDIRLIGVSSNAVKPGAGTGVNNTWKFNNLAIKEEHIGRNLRLLMLPSSSSAVGGWTTAASNSNSNSCYIQGRYISQSTDADCAVSASDSGNVIYKAILDARFTIAQNVPAGLTQEQETLLTWLAANKDALTNLLTSASSST
jgi:hypothetical protein